MGCNKTFAADFKALTMSYEELTGYNTWPKNSSATMQPRDHMSIADVRGSPRMTSGDLREENEIPMLLLFLQIKLHPKPEKAMHPVTYL